MIHSAKELLVYKKAFDLAMAVYDVTKSFPGEDGIR